MKFVENKSAHPVQFRVLYHLPQQHPLGHVANPGPARDTALEAYLIADLLPQCGGTLLGHTRRQHPRCQTPRLQYHHFPRSQQPALQEHLRHLGRFARTGRGLNYQPLSTARGGHQFSLDLIYGQLLSHRAHYARNPSQIQLHNQPGRTTETGTAQCLRRRVFPNRK